MRITREADYALRIMCLLSESENILDAKSIAERTSLTPQFTLKILRKLAGGGLVRSYKGALGGYALADGAEDTTFKTVIELIDGPLAISKCVDGGCSLAGTNKSECAIHHIFAAVSDELSRKLDGIKISEVADKAANIAEILKKIK
ncbi:MAG: Rrf2 family transcriptional regulator [Ruminococcaceae bacterium]|nr:Rrf2 family transcriptional regulator [Oscillospiraceae bacterium]